MSRKTCLLHGDLYCGVPGPPHVRILIVSGPPHVSVLMAYLVEKIYHV